MLERMGQQIWSLLWLVPNWSSRQKKKGNWYVPNVSCPKILIQEHVYGDRCIRLLHMILYHIHVYSTLVQKIQKHIDFSGVFTHPKLWVITNWSPGAAIAAVHQNRQKIFELLDVGITFWGNLGKIGENIMKPIWIPLFIIFCVRKLLDISGNHLRFFALKKWWQLFNILGTLQQPNMAMENPPWLNWWFRIWHMTSWINGPDASDSAAWGLPGTGDWT